MKLVRQFSAEYEKLKKQRHILDFSDLEHRTLDLLLGKERSAPTAVAVEVGRRFREVLVTNTRTPTASRMRFLTA